MEQCIEQIRHLYIDCHLTVKQVAKETHRSQDKVSQVLRENNWLRKQGKEPIFTIDEMSDLFIKEKIGVKEIASKYDCSICTVYNFLRANGITRAGASSKRVKLLPGARILYKERKSKDNPLYEQRTHRMVVLKADGRRIICKHEKGGFIETFEKHDVIDLFGTGHMKVL